MNVNFGVFLFNSFLIEQTWLNFLSALVYYLQLKSIWHMSIFVFERATCNCNTWSLHLVANQKADLTFQIFIHFVGILIDFKITRILFWQKSSTRRCRCAGRSLLDIRFHRLCTLFEVFKIQHFFEFDCLDKVVRYKTSLICSRSTNELFN